MKGSIVLKFRSPRVRGPRYRRVHYTTSSGSRVIFGDRRVRARAVYDTCRLANIWTDGRIYTRRAESRRERTRRCCPSYAQDAIGRTARETRLVNVRLHLFSTYPGSGLHVRCNKFPRERDPNVCSTCERSGQKYCHRGVWFQHSFELSATVSRSSAVRYRINNEQRGVNNIDLRWRFDATRDSVWPRWALLWWLRKSVGRSVPEQPRRLGISGNSFRSSPFGTVRTRLRLRSRAYCQAVKTVFQPFGGHAGEGRRPCSDGSNEFLF